MNDREQFDIWYWGNIGDENKPVIEAAWEAWQASRSCIEIELTKKMNGTTVYNYIFNMTIDDVIKALQRQGIKVKQ